MSQSQEIKNLSDRLSALEQVVIPNSSVLLHVAAAVQVLCEKNGVTYGEVINALEKASKERAAGKSTDGSAAPSPDSGSQRPEVLSAAINGIDQGSPDASEGASGRQVESGDNPATDGEILPKGESAEARKKVRIRVYNPTDASRLLDTILKLDPDAVFDPESDPVTFWVATNIPLEEIRMFRDVKDAGLAS